MDTTRRLIAAKHIVYSATIHDSKDNRKVRWRRIASGITERREDRENQRWHKKKEKNSSNKKKLKLKKNREQNKHVRTTEVRPANRDEK